MYCYSLLHIYPVQNKWLLMCHTFWYILSDITECKYLYPCSFKILWFLVRDPFLVPIDEVHRVKPWLCVDVSVHVLVLPCWISAYISYFEERKFSVPSCSRHQTRKLCGNIFTSSFGLLKNSFHPFTNLVPSNETQITEVNFCNHLLRYM
jgi:hypothetical protein